MDFYSFDDICKAADCLDVAINDLGMKETTKGRFNCPWKPGSDSGALAINKDGWYYHVDKTKGNVITLVANTKYGGEVGIQLAQEWLGKKYNLKPASHSRPKKEIVAEYSYLDKKGREVFQCVRWNPKGFSQRHRDPDDPNKWIWNLTDVITVPYMLDQWHDKEFVICCEGEKDSINVAKLGFPATTAPMGAEHWQEHFNPYFKDKTVIILRDNDDAGMSHGEVIASHLKDFAKKIISFAPSNKPKGDISDWIEDGGTADDLKKLIKDTEELDLSKLKAPIEQTEEEVRLKKAREANQKPFKNYYLVDVKDDKGNTKPKPSWSKRWLKLRIETL